MKYSSSTYLRDVNEYRLYLYKNDIPANYGGRNTYYSYEVVSYITFDLYFLVQKPRNILGN